jgi:hypothetical protein
MLFSALLSKQARGNRITSISQILITSLVSLKALRRRASRCLEGRPQPLPGPPRGPAEVCESAQQAAGVAPHRIRARGTSGRGQPVPEERRRAVPLRGLLCGVHQPVHIPHGVAGAQGNTVTVNWMRRGRLLEGDGHDVKMWNRRREKRAVRGLLFINPCCSSQGKLMVLKVA